MTRTSTISAGLMAFLLALGLTTAAHSDEIPSFPVGNYTYNVLSGTAILCLSKNRASDVSLMKDLALSLGEFVRTSMPMTRENALRDSVFNKVVSEFHSPFAVDRSGIAVIIDNKSNWFNYSNVELMLHGSFAEVILGPSKKNQPIIFDVSTGACIKLE